MGRRAFGKSVQNEARHHVLTLHLECYIYIYWTPSIFNVCLRLLKMCQAPQWDKCFEGFHAQTQWDTHTHMQSAKAKLTWSGQFHHNSNSKKVILLLDDNLALSITQSKPSQLPNLDVPWPFFVMESCMNYICVPGVPQPHYSTFAASLSECGWLPDTNVRPVLWAKPSWTIDCLNCFFSTLTISSLSFPADEPPLLCAAFCMGYFFFVPSLPWATSSVKHLVPDLLLQSCELFLASWLSCLVFLRISFWQKPELLP